MAIIAAWLHSRDKPQGGVNSRYWLMTPGNIQRRKYPQRASLRDDPRPSPE